MRVQSVTFNMQQAWVRTVAPALETLQRACKMVALLDSYLILRWARQKVQLPLSNVLVPVLTSCLSVCVLQN